MLTFRIDCIVKIHKKRLKYRVKNLLNKIFSMNKNHLTDQITILN